jgi:hypothetical protein
MSLRNVTDAEGVDWRVWDVLPQARQITGMEHGWLCFEAVTEKRRYAPIPVGWQAMEDEHLLGLLSGAAVVKSAPTLSADGVDL